MGNALKIALDKLAADGADIMITLRGVQANLGPGKVEKFDVGDAAKRFVVRRRRDGAVASRIKTRAEAEAQLLKWSSEPPTTADEGGYEIKEVDDAYDYGIYRIVSEAMAQKNGQAYKVTVPTIFDAADVAVIVEVPRNALDEPLVQGVGGRRTNGGLHIPGK